MVPSPTRTAVGPRPMVGRRPGGFRATNRRDLGSLPEQDPSDPGEQSVATQQDAADQSGADFRIEHDSMGEVRVPSWAKWRAQTQRAVENFPISGTPIERELIGAL